MATKIAVIAENARYRIRRRRSWRDLLVESIGF